MGGEENLQEMAASGSWDNEVEELHFLMKIKVWLVAFTSSHTATKI